MPVCVQNSLLRCAVSMSVLCTELSVQVRSIYVSLVYRTQCGGAQYLCQSVYRPHRGGAQYLGMFCVQNPLWRCAIYMSVCVQTSLWRFAVSTSVLCTELTAEVRSIYVSPVHRTHCGGAQSLCQSVYRTPCGGSQYLCQSAYITHCGSAQYLCQSCVQNSLWRCAVSMSVLCTELTVEVRTIYVSAGYRTHCGDAQYLCHFVYRTHCGGAQYLCQSCVQNSL